MLKQGFGLIAAVDVMILFTACGTPSSDNASTAAPVASRDPGIGRRVHVTGCENNELAVPVVNLWDSPKRTRVIGKVSGDGRPDQGLRCQGAVVIIGNVQDTLFQVETGVDDQVGWLTEPFIGRTFDTATCASFFQSSSDAARRCATNE